MDVQWDSFETLRGGVIFKSVNSLKSIMLNRNNRCSCWQVYQVFQWDITVSWDISDDCRLRIENLLKSLRKLVAESDRREERSSQRSQSRLGVMNNPPSKWEARKNRRQNQQVGTLNPDISWIAVARPRRWACHRATVPRDWFRGVPEHGTSQGEPVLSLSKEHPRTPGRTAISVVAASDSWNIRARPSLAYSEH